MDSVRLRATRVWCITPWSFPTPAWGRRAPADRHAGAGVLGSGGPLGIRTAGRSRSPTSTTPSRAVCSCALDAAWNPAHRRRRRPRLDPRADARAAAAGGGGAPYVRHRSRRHRARRASRRAALGRQPPDANEAATVMAAAGADVAGSRGGHLISALAVRGGVVFGPVVPRDGAPTREQYRRRRRLAAGCRGSRRALGRAVRPVSRRAAPATLDDFRWWAGVLVGIARAARKPPAIGSRRSTRAFSSAPTRQPEARRGSSGVLALPPFDEYYLSYADRSRVCPPEHLATIGPTLNGLVRPVLIAGRGVRHLASPTAVGRHHLPPMLDPFAAAVDAASVEAARARRPVLARVERCASQANRPAPTYEPSSLLGNTSPEPMWRMYSADPSTAHAAGR
jgi:hypothetical protein